jgi:hypothetical protein
MSRLLFFTSALSAILFFVVLFSVRRSRIRAEYSVGWLFASVALFALSQSSWLLERVAQLLHIQEPPVVLLLGVFGVFLLLFFWASILISRLRDDTIALVQRIAILEFHVEHLRQRPVQQQSSIVIHGSSIKKNI